MRQVQGHRLRSVFLLAAFTLLIGSPAARAQEAPASAQEATFEVQFPPDVVAGAADGDGRVTPEALAEHLRDRTRITHRGETPLSTWVLAWTVHGGEVVDGRPLGPAQDVSPGQRTLGDLVTQEHLAGFLETVGLLLSSGFVTQEEAFSPAEGVSLFDASPFTGDTLQQAMAAMSLPAAFLERLPLGTAEAAVVLFVAPQGARMSEFTYRPAAFVVGEP